MLNDQSPTIYGDGEQTRDFTYVDNVVEANILAATVDCELGIILNCACHEQISINQVVAEINHITGKNIKPIYTEARPGDVKHSYADISCITNVLGYKPKVFFKEGLQKTIQWFQGMKR